MPQNYSIHISGTGTPQEIKEALLGIIGGIEEAETSEHPTSAILDGAEWEDKTLITQISEKYIK